MKLLCEVDQVECIRHGIDAPSSTVKIDVDPKSLTEEQRKLVADEVHDDLRFPTHEDLKICPPTYQGFMAAIQYALKKATRPVAKLADKIVSNAKELEKFEKELKEFRQGLIKAAVEESEKLERVQGSPNEIAEQPTRMARPLAKD